MHTIQSYSINNKHYQFIRCVSRFFSVYVIVLFWLSIDNVRCESVNTAIADKLSQLIQQAANNQVVSHTLNNDIQVLPHQNSDERTLLSADHIAHIDISSTLLDQYVARQNKLYDELSSSASGASGRYLIYRDVGCGDIVGMGNRVNGFISALILAYVTDRIFLLDERLTDGTYQCAQPCHRCHTISSMINTDKININWNYPAPGMSNELDAVSTIDAWIEWKNSRQFYQSYTYTLNNNQPFRTTVINLRHELFESAATQFISCTDFNSDYMKSINALVMYSTQAYSHLLLSNPYHRNTILSHFGVNVYRRFSQYFMPHPATRIESTIHSTMKRMSDDGCRKPIGVHIRRHGGKEFLNDAGQSTIFNCAHWAVMEYSYHDLQTESISELINPSSVSTDSCIFISSDSVETRQSAKRDMSVYGVNVYWLDDTDIEVDAANVESQDNAVIDWFILRQCVDRVITAGSSFGLSAAYGSLQGTTQPLTTIQASQDKWFTGAVCVRYPAVGPISNPLLADGNGIQPFDLVTNHATPWKCISITDLGHTELLTDSHQPVSAYAISVHALYLPPQWWYTDIISRYIWPILLCITFSIALILRFVRGHFKLSWPLRRLSRVQERMSKISPAPTPNTRAQIRRTRSNSFQLVKSDSIEDMDKLNNNISFGRRRSGRLSNATEQYLYQLPRDNNNTTQLPVWPLSPSRGPTSPYLRGATSPRRSSTEARINNTHEHGYNTNTTNNSHHVQFNLANLHNRNQSYH